MLDRPRPPRARPPWPDGLIRLAGRLAGEGAGPGAPRSVELRRAISTAYYALFHELIIQATCELVDDDRAVRNGGSHPATRWFEHNDLKKLAEAVTGTGQSREQRAVASALDEPHPDLARIAEAFVVLQDVRHRADYDYNYAVRRRQALQYVDQARSAIDAARRLRDLPDTSYRRFLKLMVGGVKVAKLR